MKLAPVTSARCRCDSGVVIVVFDSRHFVITWINDTIETLLPLFSMFTNITMLSQCKKCIISSVIGYRPIYSNFNWYLARNK